MIDLVLNLADDLNRDGLGEFEPSPSVQPHESNARALELSRERSSFLLAVDFEALLSLAGSAERRRTLKHRISRPHRLGHRTRGGG
jgi:hypothetical protein